MFLEISRIFAVNMYVQEDMMICEKFFCDTIYVVTITPLMSFESFTANVFPFHYQNNYNATFCSKLEEFNFGGKHNYLSSDLSP